MRPIARFAELGRPFWAYVKLVSQGLGYSKRGGRGKPKELRRYSFDQIASLLAENGLDPAHLEEPVTGINCRLGELLCEYLNRRAVILEEQVEPELMDRDEAEAEFKRLRSELNPKCHFPMNKQKRDKRHYNFLTCIVNMLTEEALGGVQFDDNPRSLVVVTEAGKPIRTFSRWMDGAYPSCLDPHAVWETKEYYGTTTFGSRVADGVYETMLDGEEFSELELREGRKIHHYLMVDDHYTWWDCGRSYLCRIIDMLHFGLVDEVLFGREVLSQWPNIVRSWP